MSLLVVISDIRRHKIYNTAIILYTVPEIIISSNIFTETQKENTYNVQKGYNLLVENLCPHCFLLHCFLYML